MKMLRAIAFSFVFFAALGSVWATPNWLTNFDQAKSEAKNSHRLLLINFTGSDWCIWCKKLEAEIFSQPQFEQYAKDHLVLLTVDFPRSKPQAAEVQKQNEQLAAKFGIEGFPTVVVLNSSGKQVGELGYVRGGPEQFIAQIKNLPES